MADRLDRASELAWGLRNSRAVTVETLALVVVATTVPVYLTFTRYGTPIVDTLRSLWAVVLLVPVLVSLLHVLAAYHDVRLYPADAPHADQSVRIFAHALGLHLFTLHFLAANLVLGVVVGVGFLPTPVLVALGLYAAVLFGLSAGGIRSGDIEDALQAQNERAD
ncbi:MAG: hypothetical protein ABEJ06_03480 [Haloarculaceae archaeon]